MSDPLLMGADVHHRDGAGWITPNLGRRLAETALEQPTGRPGNGGHGGDAQPLVNLGPLGVVDPSHDALNPERFASHTGRDDVGVVAAAHCGARAALLD